MKEESNIRKYYAYSFFMQFSFWLPIFTIFFLDAGLSYTQMFLLSVVIAASQLILEVPSGVFADYYGRKTCLIISAVSGAAYMGILLIAHEFWIFLLGSVLFGARLAFRSGSDFAFIYDTLKDLKREKEFKKIEGKASSFGLAAMGIAAFFGGIMADSGLRIPVAATMCSLIAAAVFAILLKEPRRRKESEDRRYFLHLKEAAGFTLKHPKIKWAILFYGFMLSIMIASHKFFQPYLQMNGIELKYFGAIYLVWLLFSAFSSRISHTLEKRVGELRMLIIILIGVFLSTMMLALHFSPAGILIIFLGQFSWGAIRPVISGCINQHTESHHRATVHSLNGFFESIIGIILFPIFGCLADMYSIFFALFMQGVIALAIGSLAIILIKKSNKKLDAA